MGSRLLQPKFEAEQLERALEGAGVGIWEWIVDSGEVRWSAKAAELLGHSLRSGVRTFQEAQNTIHPEDRAASEALLAEARAGKVGDLRHGFRVLLADGGFRWVATRARVVEGPRRLIGTVWDISDSKRVEAHAARLARIQGMAGEIHELLARSRDASAMFRDACRIAVEKGLFRFAWIGMADEIEGRVLPVSSFGFADGYLDALQVSTRDEPAGRGPVGASIRENRTIVINDVEHDQAMAPWRASALRRGYRAVASFPLRRGTRAAGAIAIYAHEPRLFDAEAVSLLERLAANLSLALEQAEVEVARARAEEEVRASEARFRALVEQAADGFIVCSMDGKILDANAAAYRLLGYPAGSLAGVFTPELLGKGGASPCLEEMMLLSPGGTILCEVWLSCFDGSEVPVEANAKRLEDGRWQVVLRDLTERKRLQAQLFFSDRLATIGGIAAGAAHELSNPLTQLLSNLACIEAGLTHLGRKHPLVEIGELIDAVSDARLGADRVRRTVTDLKTFARGQDDRRGPVELHRVLEAAANLAHLPARNRATLVKDYGPLPPIEGNEARLGQLFLNLLLHAVNAIPEGRAGAHQVKLVTRTDDFGRAVVEVADTGAGIPADLVGRIFEPFATGPGQAAGAGLGLAHCQEIVTWHRGSISVESRPGAGTRFRIVLPAHEAKPPAP